MTGIGYAIPEEGCPLRLASVGIGSFLEMSSFLREEEEEEEEEGEEGGRARGGCGGGGGIGG